MLDLDLDLDLFKDLDAKCACILGLFGNLQGPKMFCLAPIFNFLSLHFWLGP